MSEIDLTGRSSQRDVTEAMRDCLAEIAAAMGPQGVGPHHMRAARFETDRPDAFHPARMEVDLAWREGFAGFRPPITITPGDRSGLAITIRFARPAGPPPAEILALAGEYSPRRQTDMTALFRRWSAEGAAFRRGRGGLDLAYGAGRFETLDLFRPEGARAAPVWVFLHGGYWQACDKAQHAQFAKGMLDAGFAVAIPNYALAPEASLETILAQTIACLNFLAVHQGELGVDASRLHLAGHSAGAQLAAMAATQAGAPPVASALLISGVFDLAPLGAIPMGKLLGLDDAARARALSPLFRPAPQARVALAYGARESAAFAQQSAEMAKAWALDAPLVVSDAHHFSALDPLHHGGALLDLALKIARG